jgi:hypothetical protein
MERESGLEDETRRNFPYIEIVGLQFAMAGGAKAMALTENLLTAHPDLAGVFADNESGSAGAVQALKSRNARDVELVAFDTSDQLLADMKAGWIDSLVVQNPPQDGLRIDARHRPPPERGNAPAPGRFRRCPDPSGRPGQARNPSPAVPGHRRLLQAAAVKRC